MKYNQINISEDGTHFKFENQKLFNKEFLEVIKFHSEGLARQIER